EQRDRGPALCALANQRISWRHRRPVISKRTQSGGAGRVSTIPREAISRPGHQAPKRHQRGDYNQGDRPKEQEGHRSSIGEYIGRAVLPISNERRKEWLQHVTAQTAFGSPPDWGSTAPMPSFIYASSWLAHRMRRYDR